MGMLIESTSINMSAVKGVVFVAPFDDIISGPLAKYMALSKEIGAEVKDQVFAS